MKIFRQLATFIFSHRLLVWSPLLFLVPVYLLTYINIGNLRSAFREQNRLALDSSAQRLAERVANFIKTNREAIGAESQITAFADGLSEVAPLSSVREVLVSLVRKNELYVTSYGLINRNGKNLVDTDQVLQGGDESNKAYFQISRLGNRVYSGGVGFINQSEAFITFAAPVRNEQGKVLGVLRSQFSGAVLQMLTASTYGLMGHGSFGVLLDKKTGIILGHGKNPSLAFHPTYQFSDSIAQRWMQSGRIPKLDNSPVQGWLETFTIGDPSITYANLLMGDSEYIGAAVDLEEISWRAIYLQPSASVKAAFREQLFSALIMAFVTALLVLGLSVGISHLLQRLKQRESQLVAANEQVNSSLAREQEHNFVMARDLELGRSVQRSLQQVPKLPRSVDVNVYHQAANFVSGDTAFVHWNRPEQTTTVILNDVTGHGVQAALKAAACQQIARTIWSAGTGKISHLKGQKLVDYDDKIEEFLKSINDTVPDYNAMLGMELDLSTGRLALYRANYNFPVIVTPRRSNGAFDRWQIENSAMKHRELVYVNLPADSFVILMSDGFLDQSRQHRQVVNTLSRELDRLGAHLTTNHIRRVLLNWTERHPLHTQDDKTFIVLHWRGDNSQQRAV